MSDVKLSYLSAPGYWKHETSGVLRPAVEAYLGGGPMTGSQIAAMRAYLDWEFGLVAQLERDQSHGFFVI